MKCQRILRSTLREDKGHTKWRGCSWCQGKSLVGSSSIMVSIFSRPASMLNRINTWLWWHERVIPALGSLTQKGQEFQAKAVKIPRLKNSVSKGLDFISSLGDTYHLLLMRWRESDLPENTQVRSENNFCFHKRGVLRLGT